MKLVRSVTVGLLILSSCGLASCGRQPAGSTESIASPRPSPATAAPSADSGPKTDSDLAEESAAGPARDSSPLGDLSQTELHELLGQERLQLDEFLIGSPGVRPTELSCASAKPHVSAICQIAERLCALEDATSLDQARQCKSARESCEDARERYEARCAG